jgi:hypothetical protein
MPQHPRHDHYNRRWRRWPEQKRGCHPPCRSQTVVVQPHGATARSPTYALAAASDSGTPRPEGHRSNASTARGASEHASAARRQRAHGPNTGRRRRWTYSKGGCGAMGVVGRHRASSLKNDPDGRGVATTPGVVAIGSFTRTGTRTVTSACLVQACV